MNGPGFLQIMLHSYVNIFDEHNYVAEDDIMMLEIERQSMNNDCKEACLYMFLWFSS